MKSVCIVIPYAYPVPAVRGGAVETLVQFLIDENEKEPVFQFFVLCTYDSGAEEQMKKYKYTKFICFTPHQYIDKAWEFIFRGIKKLFKIYIPCSLRFYSVLRHLKKNGEVYDYVLFENGMSYMLPLIAKVYPKEKILNHMHWPGDGNQKIDKSFAHLLPVSQFVADEWMKVTGRSPETVHVWRNCYNDDAFGKKVSEEEKERLRQEMGIAHNERVIIFVGRIMPEKGVKELLLALQKVPVKDIRLLLIGKANFGLDIVTKYEKEIREIIENSQYKVSQIGFVHNSELYKYYGISEIAVMPTRCDESAGMVNVETMASGVPIITTDRGGVKEYVDTAGVVIKETEFVNQLAGEIEKMLGDEEMKRTLSMKGIERASLFTKKKYFENFKQTICDIE